MSATVQRTRFPGAPLLSLFRVVLVAGGTLLLSCSAAQAQPSALSREELIRNWKTVDEWDRSERTFRVKSYTLLKPGQPPLEITVKSRPDRWLLLAEFGKDQSAFVMSPAYTFSLKRESGSAGWVLFRHFDGASPDARKFEQAANVLNRGRPLGLFFSMFEDFREPSFATMAELPDFRILRITPRGESTDEVEFEYQRISGTLTSDRRHSSLVTHSMVRSGTTGRPWTLEMKERSLYPETSRDGTPRCRRVEYVSRYGDRMGTGAEVNFHIVMEFSDYTDSFTPDEEFTLSHYGLPEPPGVKLPRKTPNYIWFLIVAGSAAILAVLFRWLARRYRRAGETPPPPAVT